MPCSAFAGCRNPRLQHVAALPAPALAFLHPKGADALEMKIAQVAPLMESVPPRLYGGTERIVSYLTEELVAAGPRRHAVRERRLHHRGQARPVLRAGAAPQCRRPRSHPLLHADARQGAPAGPRLRHHPLPHRPVPLSRSSATSPIARSRRCTAGRTCPTCCRSTPAFPRCRWSRSRMRSARRCPTRSYRRPPSITACRAICWRPRLQPARRLPRVHRAHLAREARRPRHPHRARGRHSAQDRGQGRSRRRGLLQDGDRADAELGPASSSSARSTSAARASFLGRGARACCFRSTGRSRSAS